MWNESYFWFTPPGTILSNFDYYFLWAFLALTVIGIVLKVVDRFINHAIYRKLISKKSNLSLTIGLIGLSWFGLRYENTPIFSNRYWVLVIAISLLVWLGFILKYYFTTYRTEKREFDRSVINNRYIPTRR
jgi:hypothetical protein